MYSMTYPQSITLMTQTDLIHTLQCVLADSYALYTKTQNYHWNVEGIHFKPLHELFERHYTDLANAIDVIAETIRTFGHKAYGTWSQYSHITNIADGNENADATTMIQHLTTDQKIIINTLQTAMKEAKAVDADVVIDMLTNRMSVHRTNYWMLSSMLQ